MTQLDSRIRVVSNPRQSSRCCERHPDWPTLAEHLLRDFPEIHIAEIIHELRVVRDRVSATVLDDAGALAAAEVIVRHQLERLSTAARR